MASGILQILSGEHAGQTFMIEGRMTVGRDSTAHIRINERSISRKHATIEQRDGAFFITDHGSQNGTRVNGEPVTECPLPGSCKICFGSVEAEFSLVSSGVPAQRPAEPGWQSLAPVASSGPAAEKPNLDDIFQPASLEEVDERQARKKEESQRRATDIAFIAIVGVTLILGVVVYTMIGRESAVPHRAVIVAVNEDRLVPFLRPYTGITMKDDAVATVTTDDEYQSLLKVHGNDVGETKAYLASGTRLAGVISIIVKGAAPQAREDAEFAGLPEDERIRRVETMLLQAQALQQSGNYWQALQLCRKAEIVCRPIDTELKITVRDNVNKLGTWINEKARELTQEARLLRESNRPRTVQLLNEVCRLIPDPNDLRHQRAKLIMFMKFSEQMRQPAPR